MANAASAAALSDIRYFTQRGIFSDRVLDRLGIVRFRDDLDDLTATNPARPSGLRPRPRRCATLFAKLSRRRCCSTGVKKSETCATKSCVTRRCRDSSRGRSSRCAADPPDRPPAARTLQQTAQAPAARPSRRAPHHPPQRRVGSVPFLTAWKRRHRDKPKIVAICDVTGSVARVSDFFLLLIYSLHEVVSDVRSFAFSGHLIEVSDILDSKALSGDARDHDEGRLRLVRLRQLVRRFRR